eukprot:1003308-Amphidinium_carterae.1
MKTQSWKFLPVLANVRTFCLPERQAVEQKVSHLSFLVELPSQWLGCFYGVVVLGAFKACVLHVAGKPKIYRTNPIIPRSQKLFCPSRNDTKTMRASQCDCEAAVGLSGRGPSASGGGLHPGIRGMSDFPCTSASHHTI